jgi:hypothetical protein
MIGMGEIAVLECALLLIAVPLIHSQVYKFLRRWNVFHGGFIGETELLPKRFSWLGADYEIPIPVSRVRLNHRSVDRRQRAQSQSAQSLPGL